MTHTTSRLIDAWRRHRQARVTAATARRSRLDAQTRRRYASRRFSDLVADGMVPELARHQALRESEETNFLRCHDLVGAFIQRPIATPLIIVATVVAVTLLAR